MTYELDATPYFEILHTVFRHDDDEAALSQLPQAMEWLNKRKETIERVCAKPEWLVLQCAYAYWHKNHSAVSREGIDDLIAQRQQSAGARDVIAEYDKLAESLKIWPVGDLDVPLGTRVDDWEKMRISNALKIAAAINVGSWQQPNPKNPKLAGPRDAVHFLIERFQEGLLLGDVRAEGGPLVETAHNIMTRYEAAKADRQAKQLFIKTGIRLLDDHLGGLRRKELNGILAFTGQRKTWTCRSIAYNAAKCGFRVLHIPLESDYQEEENVYSIFAANDQESPYVITKKMLEEGNMSPEQERWFREIVIPEYKNSVAENIVVYRPAGASWGEVKSVIERENFKQELDLIVIDYLTMMYTPGARDITADKMQIIQDVKQMAMNMNDGTGVSILTPIQGNRAGFDAATANEGQWELTGIFQFSEIEKSLDNCIYTWFSDALDRVNKMRMGTCKSRRHALIPPTMISVDRVSGLVGTESTPRIKASPAKATEIWPPQTPGGGLIGNLALLRRHEEEY